MRHRGSPLMSSLRQSLLQQLGQVDLRTKVGLARLRLTWRRAEGRADALAGVARLLAPQMEPLRTGNHAAAATQPRKTSHRAPTITRAKNEAAHRGRPLDCLSICPSLVVGRW